MVSVRSLLPRQGSQRRGQRRREADALLPVTLLLVDAAPLLAVHHERRRGREAAQPPAPEALRLGGVSPREPLNVVPIRAGPGQREVPALPERLVEREELLQEDEAGAPVQQGVVRRPDEPVVRFGQPEQRQAHERRLREVDAVPPVGGQIGEEPVLLLLGGRAPPVQGGEGKAHPSVHFLERRRDTLPAHSGPQHRVPLQDALPGLPERGDVQGLVQAADELLHVYPGLRGVQPVEEHALLHGRQGVGVFDLRHGP